MKTSDTIKARLTCWDLLNIAPGTTKIRCPSKDHEDKHASTSVYDNGTRWHCHVCDKGGSVIDLYMALNGVSDKDAIRALSQRLNMPGKQPQAQTVAAPSRAAQGARWRTVDTYIYNDETGRELFRVDRLENGTAKRFCQYRIENGRRVNSLGDTRRVLWRLSTLATVEDVCLTEGEKCVQALESIGIHATTNPGGSNGWRAEFADSLTGKHVWVMPDNDAPGAKWLKAVTDSFHARGIDYHIAVMPDAFNDVADLIAAHDTPKGAVFVLTKILCRSERENVTLQKAVAA